MKQNKSRRVLLTGASSFVGTHVAAAFARAGHAVTATHTKPLGDYDEVRRARLDHAARHARLVRNDIRDRGATLALLAREAPSLWIHHVGNTANYTRPDFDWIGALETTARPLSFLYPAFRETGTAVIVTGTDQEYGASEDLDREDHPCRPATPYGLSKLAETLAARQLCHSYDVPTRVARLYIPFGQYDSPAKLLPQVVRSLQAGQSIALSGGEQRRDFLGVADVCRGYLALADDMDRTLFDLFNISSGDPLRLRSLIEDICTVMGAEHDLLRFGEIPMRPGEPPLSCGDSAKALAILEWTPRPLGQAIAEDLLTAP